jgi:uncharacterized protein
LRHPPIKVPTDNRHTPVDLAQARWVFGTVEINPDRAGRDMGQVTEEVLQHLTTLPGAKVGVRVEIDAEIPNGVTDDVQRVISENCQTLRFKSHGFEGS